MPDRDGTVATRVSAKLKRLALSKAALDPKKSLQSICEWPVASALAEYVGTAEARKLAEQSRSKNA